MDLPLSALAAADFDSVKRLAGVWQDDAFDVPSLNDRARQRLLRELDALTSGKTERSPLGLVLAGAGGVGKTHLLSVLRKRALEAGCYFVLVNMTGSSDFWQTLLRGTVESLHRPGADGNAQHHALSEAIVRASGGRGFPDGIDAYFREDLRHHIRKVLDDLHGKYPWETGVYADIIRATLLLGSGDRSVSDCCRRWLRGHPIPPDEAATYGFESVRSEAQITVAGLTWLFSLGGNGTVIAVDQLDALAERRLALADIPAADPESHAAGRIIAETAEGLSALVDLTRRTLVVVSCLASTWSAFQRFSFRPFLERFDAALPLLPVRDGKEAAALVAAHMVAAADAVGFVLPYPTWPFKPEAFNGLQVFPRYLLQLCRRHLQRCLAENRVAELSSLTDDFTDQDEVDETDPGEIPEALSAGLPAENSPGISPDNGDDDSDLEPVEVMAEIPPAKEQSPLTARFFALRASAQPSAGKDKACEDAFWSPVLAAFARAVRIVHGLAEARPGEPDSAPEPAAGGGSGLTDTSPKFHAKLRALPNSGLPEHCLLIRAIIQDGIQPFRARLKGLMEEEASLETPRPALRRFVVLFPGKRPPFGQRRPKYRRDFEANGVLVFPKDEEIRSLAALAALERECPESWPEWVRSCQPLAEIRFLDKELAWLCGDGEAK